ncbi:MAG TPA: TIGR03619 family F420-dependent LLM class oxidoreductase [Acidimicrobiales bacterium]|nr:TIGR03619 family F420-dependent LLM class oxidoreductase [Acidimicrobiales bacterium]
MRVGIHLPQYGKLAGPAAIVEAARLAESLGFADVWVSDHTVHPAAQDYPSPRLFDPLLTLATAAAVTERVGLGTSVMVVPTHNPLGLANALASLDALSEGRLILGAGAGWSEAEYAALGYDFASRGRRLDEALDLFRVVWRDDPATFHGTYSDFEDVRVLPRPVGPVPIWIGGVSDTAIRRAAERGDGYQAIGLTPEQAVPLVAKVRAARPETSFTISLRTGWDPQGMEPSRIVDERAAFEEAGIQHVVAAPWQRDLPSWLTSMSTLAELLSF